MKKTNFSYLAVWAGIPAAVAAVLAILEIGRAHV